MSESELLNSFAVISFNINDISLPLKYEYLKLDDKNDKPDNVIFRSTPLQNEDNNSSNVVQPFSSGTRKNFNYWILNNGNEFVISGMPFFISTNDIENLFSGPFLTEDLAKEFLESLDYL